MDVFLFVANLSSQGHLTSALKHDLMHDCITDLECFLNIVPVSKKQTKKILSSWVSGISNHIYFIFY